MSTGNQFIEIYLDAFDKTLMIGKNGHGKSTTYLALYWCLFGKVFDKSLNVSQIINAVNGKKTVVEVEFSIGTIEYKIVRGLKPAIFEIYINGELKTQDATVRDYQKFLNNNILKMSSKTFQQIVILGSKQYTPFMRLKAAERRAVVEDLLDIQYFSIMSDIIKKRASSIKSDYEGLIAEINQLDTTIELTQIRVDELNNHNENVITNNNNNISELKTNLLTISTIVDENKGKIVNMDVASLNKKLSKLDKKHTDTVMFKSQINNNKSNTEKKVKFFHDETDCPTCEQNIPEQHKNTVLNLYTDKIKEYIKGVDKAAEMIDTFSTGMKEVQDSLDEVSKYQENVREADTQLTILNNSITSLEEQNKILSESVDTTEDEKNIEEMKTNLEVLTSNRNGIVKDLRYFNTIVELLKDGGIKTKIVDQYIPIINSLIKKYLEILDFNIEFVLDNEFKETIKSRGRDVFSYGNFSEGQKIRIDLALLFTFREISRLKNSANTNLLIMDEVADGSMDSDGIDDLIKIINSSENENSNIFVISHNSKIIEQFDNTIEFVMKNSFTEMNFANEYK